MTTEYRDYVGTLMVNASALVDALNSLLDDEPSRLSEMESDLRPHTILNLEAEIIRTTGIAKVY